jgi:hypothetical protein
VSNRTVSRILGAFALTLAMTIPFGIAHAADASLGPIAMFVPEGFVAAPVQRKDNLAVWAWTKSAPGGTVKALLEVTILDFGPKLAEASAEEIASGTEQYLRQFLGGVERRRSNYASSPIKRVQIAGGSASMASWTGRAGPADLVGVMYCTIVKSRYVVAFHTQDLGGKPTPAMHEAMAAIEAVHLAAAP